ncbi:MAG: hypothetical protein AAF629_29220 [Chloroflexota bacterium]
MSANRSPSRNSRKRTSVKDIFRLLWLLVLLPFWALFIGPILVLAGILGRVSIGTLQLRPSRQYQRGRLWAFLSGVIIWGFSWGLILWLWQGGYLNPIVATYAPSSIRSQLIAILPTNTPQPATPTATLTATPTATLRPSTTPLPSATNTETATITPSSTATVTASPKPSVTPTASATTTSSPTQTLSPTATLSPTPSNTPTAIPVIAVPTATLSLTPNTIANNSPITYEDNKLDPYQLLSQANEYLITYIQNANVDNQTRLETIWANNALTDIQAFARQINIKYQAPLTVTYQILNLTVTTPITASNITTFTMESRELWRFEDAQTQKDSLSDYIYTVQGDLNNENRWQIVDYQFKVLLNAPTATPTPLPLTSTVRITSE